MILPDSSVWIDFFGHRDTPHSQALAALLERRFEVGVGDLMLVEVLQGVRDDRQFERAERWMRAYPQVRIVDDRVAMAAARYYRALRAIGITPRKTIDTLIATRCILDRMPLLFSDRDFEPFVTHFGLAAAMDLYP